MNIIKLKGPNYIVIDTGVQIPFSMSGWPEKSPGQPYRKNEVYWTGSTVAIKTTAMQVSDYKTKKFNDLDTEITSKLMYVKKLKKLDDVRGLFIDEYKKTQLSIAEVDASIALIRTDLFEV
jgi:hypothetical protein